MIELLRDKKILICWPHADDELLFGSALFLDKRLQREVLIVSSDENNPERQWCKHRKKALAEVCELVGVKQRCLPYGSEFYKLSMRGPNPLRAFCEHVLREVRSTQYDVIHAPNCWGDYGHLDHRLLHSLLVENLPEARFVFTDIREDASWPVGPLDGLKRYLDRLTPLGAVELSEQQLAVFAQCQKIYEKYNSWTWSRPPITKYNLYSLGPTHF